MGKKKPFIDKKNATTYSLVYRSTEDADEAPEDSLVDQAAVSETQQGRNADSLSGQGENAGLRYPPGHPLAWLEEDESVEEMSGTRRRELIDLGFPDDGYDYLKHLRTLGRGAATLEGMSVPQDQMKQDAVSSSIASEGQEGRDLSVGGTGPSVYVAAPEIKPPEDDIALYDASGLMVMQAVENDEETESMIGGVSAFARRRDVDDFRLAKAHRTELEELEAAMQEAEEAEEEEQDEALMEGLLDGDLGQVKGFGDLLDDFVLGATQQRNAAMAEATATVGLGRQVNGVEEDLDASRWSSSDEYDSVEDGDQYDASNEIDGAFPQSRRPRAGSIASTYWREERSDRRKLLSVIDEHFEHLALEYDEDEIGDMEDQVDAIGGFGEVEQFDAMLNDFLATRRRLDSMHQSEGDEHGHEQEVIQNDDAGESNCVGSQLKDQLEAAGFDDDDAAVSIAAARAAIRSAAERNEGQRDEGGSHAQPREGAANEKEEEEWCFVSAPVREQWDCESILSLRSNLYNHPGTITEPLHRTENKHGAGVIRLNKAGIPIGVLPKQPDHDQNGTGASSRSGKSNLSHSSRPMDFSISHSDGDDDLERSDDRMSVTALPTERKKGETAEEKRARKAAVKAAKREARMSKKELKIMYKREDVHAKRRAASSHVQPAVIL